MKPQKLFEIFTEALADEGIRSDIINIIAGKLSEDVIEGQTELFPSADATALSAENAGLTRKIALLELENSKLRNENNELTAQLSRCKDSLNSYCSSYAMQIALYEKYKGLSPSAAKVMSGIFKNNSQSGIFLCGVQTENLKSLRDYTEQLAINSYEQSKGDIAILNELYAYMLSCHNSTYSKPVYKLTEAKAGDDFNEELHHNTGTAKSGKISAVLLQGCTAAANGKVIRKAIVII